MSEVQSIDGDSPEALLTSFNNMIKSTQEKIMAEIASANESQEFEKSSELSGKLSATLDSLAEEYKIKLEMLQIKMNSPASFYDFPCKIDLDLAVYDGDRDSFAEFDKDPNLQRACKEYEEQVGGINSRKKLLKTSLKLTPVMAPNIYQIGEKCQKVLGIDANIEFFVYQDIQFNACVYPQVKNNIYIMLSSGILEKFNDDELTFVIGHEIGHTLFNHHKYHARSIMEVGGSYLSPLHAIKLFAWMRSAEVSADRIGLICCGEYISAVKAFFKLSSGVTSDSLYFKLEDYVNQFVELNEEAATSTVDPEDWYSSHPFSPLRIKCLELFSKSDTYRKLTGKDIEISISEEEMEKEIHQFLSMMEPSHINKDEDISQLIQEFLFRSGYLIAMIDGKVDESEIQSLSSLIEQRFFKREVGLIKNSSVEEVQESLLGLIEKINQQFSPIQKLNMIRDLCIIANADGEIHPNELSVLHDLCRHLHLNPDFADQVLHDSNRPFD